MTIQKIIQNIFQSLFKGLIISIVIFCVIISIEYIFGRRLKFNNDLLTEFSYYCVYGIILSFINGAYFDYLNKKVDWEKYSKYRFFVSAFGSVLLTMIGIFIIRYVTMVIVYKTPFDKFISSEKFSYYLISLIITLVISLLFHLIYFYKAFQENRVKEQKIIAGTASAKFESLKSQIDPHFLFNSLNVLSSLIEENPENAQKFTTSLSKIYRYVLEQKDKELVTVAEELAFAKTYMNLLKMRFEDSITYEVPEDFNDEDAKVVPLSLQLLLENTIKHNIVSEKKPLHIKISIQNNELIVENNKQKKEVLQDRRGVGLQNIVSRYAILTKRNVLVEDTDEYFRIKLPILTKQISVMETTYNYNEQTAYDRAKDRVEKLKGFYANLISYCCVIPILIVINLSTSSFQWFWFPMLGWGMGLTFHGLETFGYGKSWEEKKIQEILQKGNKEESKWK